MKVSEKTKKIIPDFPKVAITYSISENEEASIDNQEMMKESILDYNEMFKTNFSLETIRAYNQDINNRLARKREKYKFRNEQLDIIIVVDRLLTGFDAPCLSTLFVDRQPMQYHDLIQAFSRTNRLFDDSKHFGQIVIFQSPHSFKDNVDTALHLYSNGGETYVLAPTWEEVKEQFIICVNNLREVVNKPEDVDELEIIMKKKFAKVFQALDRCFSALQSYLEYDDIDMQDEFAISEEEIERFYAKYKDVIEEIRKKQNEDEEELDIDIEYELETVNNSKIDYEYILLLIQYFVPSNEKESGSNNDKLEIEKYINSLNEKNPEFTSIIKDLWNDLNENPDKYQGKQISNILENIVENKIENYIHDFSEKWCVKEDVLNFVVYNYNQNEEVQNGEKELKDTSDYSAYKSKAENPVTTLKYWKTVKEEYNKMVNEKILPLQKRKL